jgi:hypothetical protein
MRSMRDSNCEQPDGTTAGAEEPYEDSGRAEREVHDADCDNLLPGDRIREGDAPRETARPIPGLPEDSTAGRAQPDAFGYRVAYQGATVTTESGSIPERMGPLVATLSNIVDRLGAK